MRAKLFLKIIIHCLQGVAVDREFFQGAFLYLPDGHSINYGFEMVQQGMDPLLCNVRVSCM